MFILVKWQTIKMKKKGYGIINKKEQNNTILSMGQIFYKFIDEYCFKSKNLYNYANYIIRQEFINNGKWIHYNELFRLVKRIQSI